MQIQPIQSTNNISHKAKFIDDNNGYFRKLWQDAIINNSFNKVVDKFHNSNKGHTLEITNVQGNIYTVFNHRNGYENQCKLHTTVKLEELMEQLMQSKYLFSEGTVSAKMFQKLTGKKIDIEHII